MLRAPEGTQTALILASQGKAAARLTFAVRNREGKTPVALNVVVAGMPNGFQGASEDGVWLTDDLTQKIMSAVPDVWLEHLPVSVLHQGGAPARPPHAVMVETSGTLKSWERERGILKRHGFDRLLNPGLKLVQSCSAGAEHVVDIIPKGVVLANASGVHSKAIAETVIASILADAKMLYRRRADQVRTRWRQLPCRELEDSVMTVLGTGHIGQAVATLAQAFSMRTVGINRSGHSVDGFDEVLPTDSLAKALVDSDYLVVAAPLTPDTRGIVGEDTLSEMKPGGYLANVARGPLVDEGALLKALSSGHLRRAFLDCHVVEPLPADNELWSQPGVEISPHDSHASQLLGDRQVALFVENLKRLASGADLVNVVEPSRGY